MSDNKKRKVSKLSGEKKSFKKFCDEIYNSNELLNYCMFLTNDSEEALELQQNTLVKILTNINSGKKLNINVVLAKTMAKNLFLDQKRQENSAYVKRFYQDYTYFYDTVEPSFENKEDYLLQEKLKHEIENLLNNIEKYLSKELDRFVFLKFYKEGQSYPQISKSLIENGFKSQKVGTLKVKNHRNVKKIIKSLKEENSIIFLNKTKQP